MQIDWIRRFQGLWLGLPPTRPGDVFEVKREWFAIRRGPVTRMDFTIKTQRGDLILVMPGDSWPGGSKYDFIPCSVNGEILYIEPMELWDRARLIG